MVTSKNQEESFEISEIDINKVVVYSEGSEIHRIVKFNCQKNGEVALFLRALPDIIFENSVRVQSRNTQILQVSVNERFIETQKVNSQEIIDLKEEIRNLEEKRTKLESERSTKSTMRRVKEAYADSLCMSKNVNLLGQSNIDSMFEFLSSYERSTRELDQLILVLKREIEKLSERILNLKLKLGKYTNESRTVKDLCVKFYLNQEQEVTFDFSYFVSGASWVPKYEIRSHGQDKNLQIMYFGEIRQKTREDWKNVKVYLSTATPFISGEPPELQTTKLYFSSPHYQGESINMFAASIAMELKQQNTMLENIEDDLIKDLSPRFAKISDINFDTQNSKQESSMAPQVAEVKVQSITTTFEISHLSNIPSDDTFHRVTIGIIDLQPDFEYVCHPSKSKHAFLRAKTINKSQYVLLQGEAKIYFDGNFISTTNFPSVSPNEEFSCFLGADPNVKVDYKPNKKFTTSSGLIYTYVSDSYETGISIKNNKKSSIKITVTEPYPLSTDSKIKVHLIDPEIEKDEHANLNQENNSVEWQLDIPAGASHTVSLVYTIGRYEQDQYTIN